MRESVRSVNRRLDRKALTPYDGPVRTTVDIDENLLREAEQKARQQGKSLGVLLEEVLQVAIQSPPPLPSDEPMNEGLEPKDPFFIALEEIRAKGCFPAPRRNVEFV